MIIECLNLPEKTYLGKNIPKVLFYNNCAMIKNQRDIFQNIIEKLILTNSLKKHTINIQPYEDENSYYEEILILKIQLKEKANISSLGEMLNSFIPYPLIIEFSYEERGWLYLCKKRKSHSVKNEFVIENPLEIEFSPKEAELLKNEALSQNSFLTYYNSLYDFIVKLRYIQEKDKELGIEDVGDVSKEKLQEIEDLKSEIAQLKNKLSKEKQMNKKAEIMKLLKEKSNKLNSLY